MSQYPYAVAAPSAGGYDMWVYTARDTRTYHGWAPDKETAMKAARRLQKTAREEASARREQRALDLANRGEMLWE